MKTLLKLALAGLVIFALLQLVRPSIPAKPATAELQAPPEVKRILEKDCYACHSDQRRLAWFDQVVPAYWLVRHDVLKARRHLNFSTMAAEPAGMQKASLYEAVNMIQLGLMPLPQFVQLHPEAKVSPEELATLKAYLAPWSNLPKPAGAMPIGMAGVAMAPKPAQTPAPANLAAIPPELNGQAFDGGFETWKPLSTTDRGDNYTFRFILGNDVAVKAVAAGNISPWPDGARLAKIAWQQEMGADGLLHPGKFIQVELMIKDAQRYNKTEGWGWGRWRGMDLKPYGKNAGFVGECTTCHLPVRGNDYVYTLPISATASSLKPSQSEIVNNRAASLPASLPYQPLGWSAITMYVDPQTRTTATLYGNDAAMQAVHARADHPGYAATSSIYPAGSVLASVTWAQRDDPHWFGARIPDAPLSVEFVSAGSYKRFAGAGLMEQAVAPADSTQRLNFVLALSPAPLP